MALLKGVYITISHSKSSQVLVSTNLVTVEILDLRCKSVSSPLYP